MDESETYDISRLVRQCGPMLLQEPRIAARATSMFGYSLSYAVVTATMAPNHDITVIFV